MDGGGLLDFAVSTTRRQTPEMKPAKINIKYIPTVCDVWVGWFRDAGEGVGLGRGGREEGGVGGWHQ